MSTGQRLDTTERQPVTPDRARIRRWLCIALVIAGPVIAVVPPDGAFANLARMVGVVFAGAGVLGLLGVNVFWGGPLDPRLDAEPLADPAGDPKPVLMFHQKRGLLQRQVHVYADSATVVQWSPADYLKFRVRLEHLLDSPIEYLERRSGIPVFQLVLFGLGVFSLCVALTVAQEKENDWIGGVILAAFLFASAGVYWLLDRFPRKPMVQVSSGTPAIVLFADRPSPEAVREFLSALRAHALESLRPVQAPTSAPGSRVDELERLFALLERGALSREEYDELKRALLGRSAPYDGIGLYL